MSFAAAVSVARKKMNTKPEHKDAESLEVTAGRRIGLLGGSFNPAHEGHLHISRLALKVLKLNEIWWLVSPQNPLKPEAGMAPLDERLQSARKIAGGENITVTDLESELGTRYTADTLSAIKQRFSEARFVWLMGADNLIQIDRWHNWTSIFEAVPIAIFARPTYSLEAESAKASSQFARYRVKPHQANQLADMDSPAWIFLKTPESSVSATEIRNRQIGNGAK